MEPAVVGLSVVAEQSREERRRQPVLVGDATAVDDMRAGDYVVELTAKSPAGDANDVVAFRVTP